jgi:hypothetical protein
VTPGHGAVKLARAALFAISAVLLAAAAHVAGGEPVSPLVAVLAVPAVTALMNLLARRRRGLPTLLPALAGTQLVLHEVFMTTAGSGSCHSDAAAMSGMPGMTTAVTMHCSMPMTQHGWSTAMLLTHGIATVLTAVVLARGEAAVWTLAQWLGLPTLPAPSAPQWPARPPAPLTRSPRPATSAPITSFTRRGPPARALAA